MKKIIGFATNNTAIDQFIIEVSLIDPINKILSQLKNGEFRDCDTKWLDKKLEGFVEFAAKTLNIKGVMPQRESVKPAYMNSYAIEYYSKYFNHLLNYFKTFLWQRKITLGNLKAMWLINFNKK